MNITGSRPSGCWLETDRIRNRKPVLRWTSITRLTALQWMASSVSRHPPRSLFASRAHGDAYHHRVGMIAKRLKAVADRRRLKQLKDEEWPRFEPMPGWVLLSLALAGPVRHQWWWKV